MLIYLGEGTRHYGRHPVQVRQRPAWEFQAVVRGEIGLRQPDRPTRFRRRRLWLFPPQHPHGWEGSGMSVAEVVVFHFPTVPEPLRQHAQGKEFLEIALDASQCARLRRLARMAQEHWTHPGPGMPLCHEYILLELSLLFLGGTQGSLNHPAKPPSGPIARSLFWFSQRLESDPGLDEVARAVGVSVAHLRRLFHQTFQMSPKSFFDQLRFQRATQLLADPSVKIESISAQCGFGSASAFSRAFKNKFGCSPDFWRTSL